MEDLQEASWRGIPFGVEAINTKSGRRVAIHEYPYRDLPWVEDLGLGPQEFGFTAFIGGNADVTADYRDFKQACDEAGPGELVHPRLGSKIATLVQCSFHESIEAANVVTMQLVFLISAENQPKDLAPDTEIDTQDEVLAEADECEDAVEGDFAENVAGAIKQGQAVVQEVTQTVRGYVGTVQGVLSDARNAITTVQVAAGSLGIDTSRTLGRFSRTIGGLQSSVGRDAGGLSTISRVNAGVTSALRGAAVARDAVVSSANYVNKMAELL